MTARRVRRTEQGLQTHERIVVAAADAFDRAGYSATSVSSLVHGIGITKGAFYFHFAAKEELAVAVVDAMHARWAPAVLGWATSDAEPLQVVLGLLDELVVRACGDAVVRGGMRLVLERELVGAGLLDPFPEWERILAHALQRAVRDGLLGPGACPRTTAHLVVFGLVGELVASGRTRDPQVLGRRVDQLVSALFSSSTYPVRDGGWQDPARSGRTLVVPEQQVRQHA